MDGGNEKYRWSKPKWQAFSTNCCLKPRGMKFCQKEQRLEGFRHWEGIQNCCFADLRRKANEAERENNRHGWTLGLKYSSYISPQALPTKYSFPGLTPWHSGFLHYLPLSGSQEDVAVLCFSSVQKGRKTHPIKALLPKSSHFAAGNGMTAFFRLKQ